MYLSFLHAALLSLAEPQQLLFFFACFNRVCLSAHVVDIKAAFSLQLVSRLDPERPTHHLTPEPFGWPVCHDLRPALWYCLASKCLQSEKPWIPSPGESVEALGFTSQDYTQLSGHELWVKSEYKQPNEVSL